MGHVTVGIAQSLLEQETEPLRFERFCCDLVGAIEGGVRIVTTSSNYDRGRDGVSIGSPLKVILLCSLTDELEEKALSDAKTLAKHIGAKRPDAVYFCSSQSFTEAKGDKIEAAMRTALSLPAGFDRITVLSGLKIAQLGSKQDGLYERHYPGELTDIRKALAESSNAEEAERALRLALSTSTTDDAAVIREDVWGALLRLHLAKGAVTAAVLSVNISNYLRLSAAIATPVLIAHLNALVASRQVEVDGGVYSLTSDGEVAFEADEARVAKGVLAGKDALVSAIKAHLKTAITAGQADRMWHAVQEKIATLFHERGQEVLSQVSLLLGSSREADETPEFDLLSELANAAGNAFDHPDQREEVKTAIRDIVVEGESEAVKWLTRAAYAFVCACAMGLEARTRAALEQVVGGTNLIFDTDVVLTYLSADEPAHDAVLAIRERWRGLGGESSAC